MSNRVRSILSMLKKLQREDPKEYLKLQQEIMREVLSKKEMRELFYGELLKDQEFIDEITKQVGFRLGRRSFLGDVAKAGAFVLGLSAFANVADARTVITDKNVIIDGQYYFPLVIPASVEVYKDDSGRVIARDIFGRTVVRGSGGVDDAQVIKQAIDVARQSSVKEYVVNPTNNKRNFPISEVVLNGRFTIRQKIEIPPFPSGYTPSGVEDTVFVKIRGVNCILDCKNIQDDTVFHIYGESGKYIIQAFVENILAYADPNNPVDLFKLEYFSTIIKNIRAYGFRRFATMKTGWDTWFEHIRAFCYPNDSNLGVFHIEATDYNNTNSLRIVDSFAMVLSPNGWVFKCDDLDAHDVFFEHFHSHDGFAGDGCLDLSNVKSAIYISKESNITHNKWAIYAPGRSVYISDSFISGPVKITTGAYVCKVDNSKFVTSPSNGNFEFSGCLISNSEFIGQTVIKEACKVCNCKFFPKENQDFVLQCITSADYLTVFSNILVTDWSPYDAQKHTCNTLILIGTRDHAFVSGQPEFDLLELTSYVTKYGIYIETGNAGNNVDKVIISNARRMKVNADNVYTDAYLIYSEVNIPVIFSGENILVNEDKYTLANTNVDIQTIGRIVYATTGKFSRNSGTATFSGDASTKVFTIAHGLVAKPSKIKVWPMSADACLDFYVTADDTYIYVNYLTAPPSGTDNVVLGWEAEV